MTWLQWANQQPVTRGPRRLHDEPDLGPTFSEETFPGIQIVRHTVSADDWSDVKDQIEAGSVTIGGQAFRLDVESWSAVKLFTQQGLTEAHRTLAGVRRPVRGIAGVTKTGEVPTSQPHWVQGGSPEPLEKQTRDALNGKQVFTHWPRSLLGIEWLGGAEQPPPQAFVVGVAQGGIWVADVVPDHDNNQLRIVLAWEADQVDPISCSLSVRTERDGVPLLVRHWRVSDLPSELAVDDQGRETRHLEWNERTIDVRLPRGARRTEWGMSLFAPEGSLADERPVVRRIESIESSMFVDGSSEPARTFVVGDRNPAPSEVERDEEARAAKQAEVETQEAAARRRIANTDELEHYLRWRFSARCGELLIIDRYLLANNEETVKRVLAFLAKFNREIRALVTLPHESATALLANAEGITARRMSKDEIHDRLWLVGEAGVAVGGSVNTFVKETPGESVPATTAVELPFADAAAWRSRFESWWAASDPV